MRYDAVIFDFDGTLFDTHDLYTREYLKLGSQYGFHDKYEDVFLWLSKHSVGYAIRQHDWGCRYREIAELYRPMRDKTVIEEAVPIQGCLEILKYVKDNGGQNFLYTDNNEVVYDCLKKWNMKNYFDGASFGRFGFPSKPAPDGLFELMEQYHLAPEKCLVVGDRDADILAGSAANVDGVLFDLFNYYPDLSVKYRVTSLMEIANLLNS